MRATTTGVQNMRYVLQSGEITQERGSESSVYRIVQLKGRSEPNWETAS